MQGMVTVVPVSFDGKIEALDAVPDVAKMACRERYADRPGWTVLQKELMDTTKDDAWAIRYCP